MRVALSLAAVLGLLWFLQRRFARKTTRRRDAEAITVLGRQNLGAKAQLVVVQTADARYVLGVTEHGVNVVDKLAAEAPTTDETDTAGVSVNSAPQHPQDEAPSPSATAFDSILAGASTTPVPQLRRRVRHRNDPLRGSIISPETWRQTAEALRRSR
nr:flagellar biosynthetic protein FliO [Microbacterium aerolatum]